MERNPFKEYIRQTEPNKRERGYVWNTAIGLQAVDGLKPSKYLVETAIRHIEGILQLSRFSSGLMPTITKSQLQIVKNGQRKLTKFRHG